MRVILLGCGILPILSGIDGLKRLERYEIAGRLALEESGAIFSQKVLYTVIMLMYSMN